MVGLMSSALSIAANGLQAANRQFETAARSVISSGIAAQNGAGGASTSTLSGSQANSQAPAASLPPPTPIFEVPDLATSIVDLKQAEVSYKAQIDVLNIASKLEEEAINLVA